MKEFLFRVFDIPKHVVFTVFVVGLVAALHLAWDMNWIGPISFRNHYWAIFFAGLSLTVSFFWALWTNRTSWRSEKFFIFFCSFLIYGATSATLALLWWIFLRNGSGDLGVALIIMVSSVVLAVLTLCWAVYHIGSCARAAFFSKSGV